MSPTPTGRVVPRDGALEVVLTRTFDAPITDVWDALTVSERLAPWIGTYTGDGRTGAVDFVMTAEGATEASRMEVLRCEAPTGLTVRQDAGDGEVWTLYLDLAEADGVTTLAFAQRDLTAEAASSVGPGWEYYLDRLVASETGGDVSAIDWDDYYPAMVSHYGGEAAQP